MQDNTIGKYKLSDSGTRDLALAVIRSALIENDSEFFWSEDFEFYCDLANLSSAWVRDLTLRKSKMAS